MEYKERLRPNVVLFQAGSINTVGMSRVEVQKTVISSKKALKKTLENGCSISTIGM